MKVLHGTSIHLKRVRRWQSIMSQPTISHANRGEEIPLHGAIIHLRRAISAWCIYTFKKGNGARVQFSRLFLRFSGSRLHTPDRDEVRMPADAHSGLGAHRGEKRHTQEVKISCPQGTHHTRSDSAYELGCKGSAVICRFHNTTSCSPVLDRVVHLTGSHA